MIKQKRAALTIVIDLDGPQGNAYFLLGYAQKLMGQLGYPEDEQNTVLDEMKELDYNNLVSQFDYHFGDYVTLETSNEQLLKL